MSVGCVAIAVVSASLVSFAFVFSVIALGALVSMAVGYLVGIFFGGPDGH